MPGEPLDDIRHLCQYFHLISGSASVFLWFGIVAPRLMIKRSDGFHVILSAFSRRSFIPFSLSVGTERIIILPKNFYFL